MLGKSSLLSQYPNLKKCTKLRYMYRVRESPINAILKFRGTLVLFVIEGDTVVVIEDSFLELCFKLGIGFEPYLLKNRPVVPTEAYYNEGNKPPLATLPIMRTIGHF